MTGSGRIGQKLLLFTVALFTTLTLSATPIRPDLGKLLKQQQNRPTRFIPARAGWDGPETTSQNQIPLNPVYEAYGPGATARAIRAGLLSAAIPDPRALAGIVLLIVLLRLLRYIDARNRRKLLLAGSGGGSLVVVDREIPKAA